MRALFRALSRVCIAHFAALLALAGLGVGAALLTTGGVYVASQSSRFCIPCHYIEPYYQQWQTSSHAEVSCVECHPVQPLANAVAAVRYFTNTYDPRPHAEVSSANCLQSGCHETRLLEGELTFGGKVRFDHAPHLKRLRRDKELQCTSCHAQIVQGEHISATQETCFLCHFKGVGEAQSIGGCTNCHGTPAQTVQHGGFIFSHDTYMEVGVECQQCHLQITEGDGGVPEERCYTCHVERLERYEDSQFMHAKHVAESSINCFNCHEKIRHGDVRLIRALETGCENCHKSLHLPQKQMYLGSGGKGVPDIPSRMFAAQVSCDGCHTHTVHIGTPEFDETILEAERQSCVDCHGPGYDLMLDDWRRKMDRLVEVFGPEVEGAEAALRRLERTDADLTTARLQVEKARHNLDFVQFGHGVHNVEYAVRLIRAAAGYLDDAMGRMDPVYDPPDRMPLVGTEDAYCTALCHARLGLPQETQFDHMTFPHALHVEDVEVECTACHSPEKHKMQIVTRSECMSCHHEAQDIDCSHCHLPQQALYSGKVADWGWDEGYPDVMAEDGVTCDECHDLSAPLSITELQQGCVDCHEAGYDEMLRQWMGETQKNLGRATVLAADVERSIALARRRRTEVANATELFERAKSLMQLVDRGKAVHNRELSLELLQEAEAQLRQALEEAGGVSAAADD